MIFHNLINLYFYYGFPYPCSRLTVFLIDSWLQIHYYLMMILLFIITVFIIILFKSLSLTYLRKPLNYRRRIIFYFDRKFFYGSKLEVLWTLLPLIILFQIAKPAFTYIYDNDCFRDRKFFIRVIGHQWYWSYEYPEIIGLTKLNLSEKLIIEYYNDYINKFIFEFLYNLLEYNNEIIFNNDNYKNYIINIKIYNKFKFLNEIKEIEFINDISKFIKFYKSYLKNDLLYIYKDNFFFKYNKYLYIYNEEIIYNANILKSLTINELEIFNNKFKIILNKVQNLNLNFERFYDNLNKFFYLKMNVQKPFLKFDSYMLEIKNFKEFNKYRLLGSR